MDAPEYDREIREVFAGFGASIVPYAFTRPWIQSLKEQGVKAVIAPTPRSASKCCGISLLVREEDIEKIRCCVQENSIEILDIVTVERDVNPGRDRYC